MKKIIFESADGKYRQIAEKNNIKSIITAQKHVADGMKRDEKEQWKNFEEAYTFYKSNESFIEKPYLDTEGKVTIGIGHLIETRHEFDLLPLKNREGNPATQEQKDIAWAMVNAEKHKKENYNENGKFNLIAKSFPNNHGLTISEEDADNYMRNYMRGEVKHLRRKFPNFDSLRKEVQIVLMDIQCNVGDKEFNENNWPELFKAVRKKDYGRIKKEVSRKNLHDRNKKSIALIEKADADERAEKAKQNAQNPKSDQNEGKGQSESKADTNPQQESQSESNNKAPREAKGDGVYRDDEDHSPPKENDAKKEKPKAKKPSDKKLLRMMTTEDAASLISKKKSIAEVIKDIAKREGLLLGDQLTEQEEKPEIGDNHTIMPYKPGKDYKPHNMPADGKINHVAQNRLHNRPIRGLLGDVLDDEDEVGSLLRPPRRPRRANTETLVRRGKRVYRVNGPKGPRGSFYSGW